MEPNKEEVKQALGKALQAYHDSEDADGNKDERYMRAAEILRERYFAAPDAPVKREPYRAPTISEIGQNLQKDFREASETYGRALKVGEELGQGRFSKGQYEGRGGYPTAFALAATEGVIPSMAQAGGALLKAGAQTIAPSFIEEPVVETYKDAEEGVINFFAENPWANKVLDLAKENLGDYLNWKNASEENELKARKLESAFDIALLATPSTKVSPVTDKLGLIQASNKLKREADKERPANIRDDVQEMLEPLKIEQAMGETVAVGRWDKKTYIPTKWEEEAIDLVSTLEKFDTKRGEGYNIPIIQNYISNYAKKLESRIKKAGNPKYDKDLMIAELQQELAKLTKKKSTKEEAVDFRLEGGSASFTNDYLQKAIHVLNRYPDNALGILQARKEIDAYFNSVRPGAMETTYGDRVNSEKIVATLIRDKFNQQLIESVPNVDVDGLLRKQSLLFDAKSTLRSKFDAEARELQARVRNNVKRVTGITLPSTPLSLALTASYAATAAYAPYVAGGLAVAGSGYYLKKNLNTASVKKGLAAFISGIDKAIKKTENSTMLSQLKADRLWLITLLNDLNAAPKEIKEQEEREEKEGTR